MYFQPPQNYVENHRMIIVPRLSQASAPIRTIAKSYGYE